MNLKHCLTVLVILCGSATAIRAQDDTATLERRVKAELGIGYDELYSIAPINERLLRLGERDASVAVLLGIVTNNQLAKTRTVEYGYLTSAIFALGKLKELSAIPILVTTARSSESVRVYCFQAIGEIDAVGSKNILLQGLRDRDYAVRKGSAVGLARIEDPSVLMVLDVVASQERSLDTTRALQQIADGLRSRIRDKAK